jgi:hypothetical protein
MAVVGLGVDSEDVIAVGIRRRKRHEASVPPSETNLGEAMTSAMARRLQVTIEEDRLMTPHAVITYPDRKRGDDRVRTRCRNQTEYECCSETCRSLCTYMTLHAQPPTVCGNHFPPLEALV